MDFRRQKLFLALGIMALGMAFTLVWDGWQGYVLGRGYPYDAFLFPARQKFGDLLTHLISSGLPSPYLYNITNYFPFTYVVLRFLSGAPIAVCSFYFSAMAVGLALVLREALPPVTNSVVESYLVPVALLGLSYPVLMSLDRGNLESAMTVLIALSLLAFRRHRWHKGLALLFPAICLKLYPILLMALFVRRGHLGKIVLAGVVFALVTLASLATFAGTLADNWRLWQGNLDYYRQHYVIGDWGFAGSASPWNTLKALVVTLYDSNGLSWLGHVGSRQELVEFVYRGYTVTALAAIVALVAFGVLVEREFYRRAILLLLAMTMSAPNGGDYRLLYVEMAFVILTLLPTRRRHDLLVTGLLAFTTLPKKEILLPFLGETDSRFHDVPIAILINPPVMLIAMGLLIHDGFSPGAGKRAWLRGQGLIRSLRFGPVITRD